MSADLFQGKVLIKALIYSKWHTLLSKYLEQEYSEPCSYRTTTSCTCNSTWLGCENVKPLGGLVNEMSQSLYVPHVAESHTHFYPKSTPFCSLVSPWFFLWIFLAPSMSSAVFSHISFVSSWLLFPPVYYCSFSLTFPARWTEQREKERGEVGDKQQSVQFSLGGQCPGCLLMACHNSNSQCKR